MVVFSRLGRTTGTGRTAGPSRAGGLRHKARLSRTARTALVLAASLVTVGALGACTDAAAPSAKHPTPSATQTSAPTATVQPTPTDPPTPVALTCEQVITAEQLYAFNPNYGTDPGYAPAVGSQAATAVAAQGVACGYLNQTSNTVIEIAIARPAASELTKLKDAAISGSNVVPTYGVPPAVEGYFGTKNGVGDAQAFSNGYWVVLSSKDFAEPGDPQPLMASVLANLPKG